MFTDAKLREYGIPENKWKDWKRMKDEIPNLQLLPGRENTAKGKTSLVKWLYGSNKEGKPNVQNMEQYLQENYFPRDTSIEFRDFEEFFTKRKAIVEDALAEIPLLPS